LVDNELDFVFFEQRLQIEKMAKETTADSKGKVEYTTRPTKIHNLDAYKDKD